jgi:hypothetical protein
MPNVCMRLQGIQTRYDQKFPFLSFHLTSLSKPASTLVFFLSPYLFLPQEKPAFLFRNCIIGVLYAQRKRRATYDPVQVCLSVCLSRLSSHRYNNDLG